MHVLQRNNFYRRSRHWTMLSWYVGQELGDQQFPEQRGKIWIQNKLEWERQHRGSASSYLGCASLTPEELGYSNKGPGERNDRSRGLQTYAGYIIYYYYYYYYANKHWRMWFAVSALQFTFWTIFFLYLSQPMWATHFQLQRHLVPHHCNCIKRYHIWFHSEQKFNKLPSPSRISIV
jgi:hypothetical protein